MIKRIIAILIILTTVCSCSLIKTPESTVEKFISCYRQGDMDGMIKCMSPSAQAEYKAVMEVSKGLLSFFGMGVDVDVILKGAFSFGVSDGSIAIDDMKILSTEQLTKTTAIVVVGIYDTSGNLYERSEIDMILTDGEWYIDFDWEGLF